MVTQVGTYLWEEGYRDTNTKAVPPYNCGDGSDLKDFKVFLAEPMFAVGDVINLGLGPNARIMSIQTEEDWWDDITVITLMLITSDPNDRITIVTDVVKVYSSYQMHMMDIGSINVMPPSEIIKYIP